MIKLLRFFFPAAEGSGGCSTSGGSCQDFNECCNEVDQLLEDPSADCRNIPAHLEKHLDECCDCAKAVEAERCICEVVAPDQLPRPSLSFELQLMERLEISPEPKPSPVSQWGWTGAWAAVLLVAALNAGMLAETAVRAGQQIYAGAMAQFAGRSVVLIERISDLLAEIPPLSGMDFGVGVNLALMLFTAMGGAVLFGLSQRR